MRLELGYEIRSDRDFDIIIENSGEISDETLQSLMRNYKVQICKWKQRQLLILTED